MKKLLLMALLAFAIMPAMAQQHNCKHSCGNCPHHKQQQAQQATAQQPKTINGMPAEIVKAFPNAKSVKAEKKWTVVYGDKNTVMGYAVYSKPASDGIKGYAGETPLMIALDANQNIKCVTLLDNQETPGYLNLVINAGLLKSWDGMKPSKAVKKKVDTVTGATFSSSSIIKTLQAALKSL